MRRETLKKLYIQAVINEASPEEFILMIQTEMSIKKKDDVKERIARIPNIDKAVADFIGIPKINLYEKRRFRDSHVFPRQLCMYLRKKHTRESLAAIGKRYGDKDHATVLHACKTIQNLMDTDKEIKRVVVAIEKKLKV